MNVHPMLIATLTIGWLGSSYLAWWFERRSRTLQDALTGVCDRFERASALVDESLAREGHAYADFNVMRETMANAAGMPKDATWGEITVRTYELRYVAGFPPAKPTLYLHPEQAES